MSAYIKSLITRLEDLYQKKWVESQALTGSEAECIRRTISELQKIEQPKPRKRKCPTCGGSGQLMKEPFCPTCNGSGKVTR